MVTKEKQSKKDDFAINIRHIYCRLARPETFKDSLDSIPYEKMMDMILTYYVRIDITRNEFISIVVNKKLMENWNITKEQLKEIAWSNTVRDNPAVFKPLKQVLAEFGIDPEEENRQVYLISNEHKYLGAVCIAYPGFLEKIGRQLNGDFYILPSSIHECLVLPCSEGVKVSELRETVKNINRTELKNKDILSDSVYRYNRDGKSLVIDNS